MREGERESDRKKKQRKSERTANLDKCFLPLDINGHASNGTTVHVFTVVSYIN